jgi:hypothetical protein
MSVYSFELLLEFFLLRKTHANPLRLCIGGRTQIMGRYGSRWEDTHKRLNPPELPSNACNAILGYRVMHAAATSVPSLFVLSSLHQRMKLGATTTRQLCSRTSNNNRTNSGVAFKV